MSRGLEELARELDEIGEAYVRATVVWVRPPASGHVGDRAIIRADGTLEGWIGGACTEPVVRAEARDALVEGRPRLIALAPDGTGGSVRPGVRSVAMSCASEGALEIFMEPVIPRPQVAIIGRSPAVAKLAQMLEIMEWRVTVIDDEAKGAGLPGELAVVPGFAETGPMAGGAIVVATQGHYDEDALAWAVQTEAAHIGLVASRTRSEILLDHLRAIGVAESEVARITTPAGVDLGHIDHEEIAVAVLAELVQLRAQGVFEGAEGASAPPPETAIDPVCGMTVEVSGARYTHEHVGVVFYFCCPACRKGFIDDPGAFTAA